MDICPTLKLIVEKITDCLGTDAVELRLTPSLELGDLALSVFEVAKRAGEDPQNLARLLASALEEVPGIEEVKVANNGFVNLRLAYKALFEPICIAIVDPRALLPRLACGRIMVEYFSPNTNKPLHLGHARNIILGDAISNLLEAIGYEVVRATLYNDRGIHISKAQLAYRLYGDAATPKVAGMKGDQFVGRFYTLFSKKLKGDPSLEEQAQELLRRWERGDLEVYMEWRKLRDWVITGFQETLERLGTKPFEVVFWESEFWDKGVQMVQEGLGKGLFERGENGAIVAKLGQDWYVPVLRTDSTALYITQDLYLARLKFERYGPLQKSIYVVAAEQKDHFKNLFEILRRWGFDWADRCYHLGYGLVLVGGGKLKSREGSVAAADIDAILDKLESMTLTELETRNAHLDKAQKLQRANLIARAALRWHLLKFNALKDIHFDPATSLSLKGDTGPYLLYTYARIRSLVRKAGFENLRLPSLSSSEVTPEERRLAAEVIIFPKTVATAAYQLNPSLVSTHLVRIANLFNTYYEHYRVLEAANNIRMHRLILCSAVGEILKWGLGLLGIEALEEM